MRATLPQSRFDAALLQDNHVRNPPKQNLTHSIGSPRSLLVGLSPAHSFGTAGCLLALNGRAPARSTVLGGGERDRGRGDTPGEYCPARRPSEVTMARPTLPLSSSGPTPASPKPGPVRSES